jgi:hypothetical protein
VTCGSGCSGFPSGPIVAGTLLVIAALAGFPPRAAAADPPSLPAREVRAWQTGLLRTDRLQHASLALTLGLGIGAVTRDPWAAFGGVSALALGKEVADRHRTGFDPVDLTAGVIGAGAAALITSTWRH